MGFSWLRHLTPIVNQEVSTRFPALRIGLNENLIPSTVFNSGFLIMQNTPELQGILQDWLDCPDKVSMGFQQMQ